MKREASWSACAPASLFRLPLTYVGPGSSVFFLLSPKKLRTVRGLVGGSPRKALKKLRTVSGGYFGLYDTMGGE